MVAIEPILGDIKQKLKTDVVRLPRADELDSFNLSPKLPLTISDEYSLPTPGNPTMDVGNQSHGLDATFPVSQSQYVSDGFQSPDQTTEKLTVTSNSRWSSQDLNPISQPTTSQGRLNDQVVLTRNRVISQDLRWKLKLETVTRSHL